MKEISVEEKAKRYDEAIKRAKSKIKNDKDHVLYEDDVIEIFPELKESEDKRVKNALIEMVHDTTGDSLWVDYGIHKEDALNWLENQGEQKPAWSEEDEKLVKNLISTLSNLYARNLIEKETKEKYTNLLKSLKDRMQPQPKQEWSQNDIDMIDWLIRCCEKEHEELCNDKYGHQDIVSDLKKDCRKKWNWLESLKNKVVPQNRWKPSDEQIRVVNRLRHCFLSDVSGNDIVILDALLEQLKKL